ncbi:Isochorismatase-like protein [Exophiala viscosa]|uniref:Isochorismatase-like protein n=1 Tax=Exophiala viscosa TaxID=2486360 RepID=A0AAN6E3W4_9EURO|nr:Isochorismatase-like protein [Exophiala viscosa]
MATEKQALVLIDPLNDFIHPEGKLYPAVQDSLTKTNTVENLRRLAHGAREKGIPIYYGLHQQYKEGNYDGWKHAKQNHERSKQSQAFAGWGGEILEGYEPQLSNGDVVVSRHWNSSSFRNTDLDYQLRQRDITHLTFAGLVTNTCVESTAREAVELGYKVTLISDATAGFSQALKEAATDVIWPTIYVDEVLKTEEWVARLKKV